MLDEAKIAISENGGTLFGALATGAGLLWALLKVGAVFFSNLASVAKSNEIHNEMLTTLQHERDTALQKLDVLTDKYYQLYREWSDLNAQLLSMKVRMEALQKDLTEANTVINSLSGRVEKASRAIVDSQPPVGDDLGKQET